MGDRFFTGERNLLRRRRAVFLCLLATTWRSPDLIYFIRFCECTTGTIVYVDQESPMGLGLGRLWACGVVGAYSDGCV